MRDRAWMAALMAAGMVAAAPAGADVKDGVDAWTRGDYAIAVEQWRGPAAAGNADAEFNMGQAYKLGRGVPIDTALAESWFRKAALQGHEQAQDNYGLSLFQNDRKADALPWLEKSVARSEPRAMLVLGTMLFNGDGVARDYPRAYALMTRASAAGLPSAATTLAEMDRYITPADRERGVALSRQETHALSPAKPAVAGIRTAATPSRPHAEPMRVAAVSRPVATSATPQTMPVATGGSWRIQLGAFRDRGNAQALWQQVAPRLGGASPSYVAGGGVTRLQAGGYPSKTAALRTCKALRTTGDACVVVTR